MGRVRSVFAGGEGAPPTERRRFTLFLVLFALILVIVNLAGWRVYAAMRNTLEGELGQRLITIATAAAAPIDPDYIAEMREDPEESLGGLIVRDQFERLRSRVEVGNLVLLDIDGRSLVDLDRTTPPGEPHPLPILHPDAFTAAVSGIAATSGLYSSLGTRYKNGYAPVVDTGGVVVGVVAVEAGAAFLESLGQIRRVVLLASAASFAAIVLLGGIFLRLLRVQARLDEAMRRTETLSLMGEMAASVAHETRNPLGVIRATAERLRRSHGRGEEIFDYIPEEVDRLDAILSAYLDFARRGGRIGAGGACDLAEVTETVLRLTRRDLEQAGVAVTIDVPDGMRIAVDAGGMQQVLLNLILNARQAMTGGGALTLAARRDGNRLRLEVSDTGVGIAPGDRDRIFEPFYSGRERGSGLGLAIAKRIVTDSGGAIDVESRPGSGTTFTVWMPAV